MSNLLERYSLGLIAVPVALDLQRRGAFDTLVPGSPWERQELARRWQLDAQAAAVWVEALLALGWIRLDGAGRVVACPAVRDACWLGEAALAGMCLAPHAALGKTELDALAAGLALAQQARTGAAADLADAIDGAVLLPLLAKLRADGVLEVDATEKGDKLVMRLSTSAVSAWLNERGLARRANKHWYLSADGAALVALAGAALDWNVNLARLAEFGAGRAPLQAPRAFVERLLRPARSRAAAAAVADRLAQAALASGFRTEHDPRAAEAELGEFLFRWAFTVLCGIGLVHREGETASRAELRARLGIVPKYHRYFDSLLERLAARGLLAVDGELVRALEPAARYGLADTDAEVGAFLEAFRRRHPLFTGPTAFVSRALSRYEAILTGTLHIAAVMFADADMDTFAGISRGEPVTDFFNNLVAAGLMEAALHCMRDAGSVVRILEVGAGTGATAEVALQRLAAAGVPVRFCFSDISPTFVRQARERFGERYPWVEYAVLNIEDQDSVTAMPVHGFDIVYAGNVLHDTRDLAATLAQVKRLLKPGAVLLLNEYTEVKDWLFFSGALLHGPWLYTDPERRMEGFCLSSTPQWMHLLQQAGFRGAQAFCLPTQDIAGACGQSVIVCVGPADFEVADASPAAPAAPAAPAPASAPPSAGNDLVGQEAERAILSLLGPERATGYRPERPLMELGLDSVELVELRSILGKRFGTKLPASFFFEHPTQARLAAALAALRPQSAVHAATGRTRAPEVAIVGVACRFPGGADSPDAFWQLLRRAGDAIVPLDDRFAWPASIDPNGSHMGIDRGGFLPRIDEFDAGFFRVSPKEAELMDPQQRLLLELAWEALEDAGHRPSATARCTGLFVGVCHGDYRDLLAATTSDAYVASGSAPSMLANRISYFFDFKGPSVVVDTACSASLVALDLAAESVRKGDCAQALVGAVNLICSPANSVAYYESGMLSPRWHCHTFDAGADGYVRGEGGAMLVLKRLDAALADGDTVYGLVAGSAVNHGGQASSLTAPNPAAQAEVIERAMRQAGAGPDTIGYVEAHGTGTRLGDPIEIAGLRAAYRHLFEQSGITAPASAYCAIGSVKTNIGHLEGAAGMAGLVKVLESLRHSELPATRNFVSLNPEIDLNGAPFYVLQAHQPWPVPRDALGQPLARRAGISSFGFGGSNAHAVIEEWPHQPAAAVTRAPQLVVLSARSPERLAALVRRWLEFLASPGVQVPALCDIAYTLQVGREPMDERLACVVDDVAQLEQVLRQYLGGAASGARFASGKARRNGAGAAAGGLLELGLAWVGGAEIDWAALHDGPRRRVRLPTYAFARERYWIPAGASKGEEAALLLLRPVWRAAVPGAPRMARRTVVLAVPDTARAQAVAAALPAADCRMLAGAADPARRCAELAEQLLALLRQAVAAEPDAGLLVQLLVEGSGEQLLAAGLIGMLRSVMHEYPAVRGQVVVLDGTDMPAQVAAHLDESAMCAGSEIEFRAGVCHFFSWEEMVPARPPSPWRAGGVYLVTGGAGGLGRLVAADILRHATGAQVLLVGRRAAPDPAAWQALQEFGARVHYRSADVGNAAAVQDLVQEVVRRFGALHGIVHAAGVIEDAYLVHKTAEQLQAVLRPKLDGTLNLDRASADLDLDLFVCFSSIASALGNPGQADYAAANGVLDRFVRHRNELVRAGQRRGASLAIHWPLWRDGGMQVGAATEEAMLQRFGLRPLSGADGLDALWRAIASGAERVLVMSGARAAMLRAITAGPGHAAAAAPPVAPAAAAPGANLEAALVGRLCAQVSELLRLRGDDVDAAAPLSEFGFDSISLTRFANQLNREFGLELTPTVFYHHRTLSELARHLAATHAEELGAHFSVAPAPSAMRSRTAAEPIPSRVPAVDSAKVAVIGMAARLPGASDVEAFWDNLVHGRDSIVEVPAQRWDWRAFADAAGDAVHTKVKWGAFIDGIDEFDPLFFQISPREALAMDPQQRLLMMCIWKALEDAGYAPDSLAGKKVGIFVGTGRSDYGTLLKEAGLPIESHSSIGLMPSAGPNRISHLLDLRGPSEAFDATCASSLVALHRALGAMRDGECDMAIVGGVNTMTGPDLHISLAKASVLCEDGRCKSFSDQADGYVRGEGVGILVLKRIEAAERDGDHIYGLVVASGVNHGGRATTLTAPNPQAQAELVADVYARAGVAADSIDYIEAHGPGTALGDVLEVDGLKAAFAALHGSRTAAPRRGYCGLASVKSNIGALEVAAGVAGMIKVLLQLRHQMLVRTLHCERVNPELRLEDSPFYVLQRNIPWPAAAVGAPPRRAGVSAFNITGVNAHVVLEEYRAPAPAHTPTAGPHAVVLSARDAVRLHEQAAQLLAALRGPALAGVGLGDLAYTLQVGRTAMDERLAFAVDDLEQLRHGLEHFLDSGVAGSGAYRGQGNVKTGALAALSEDETFQVIVEKWLARGAINKVLELWVQGIHVDWQRLHTPGTVRRVPLPTYPFARESYWPARHEGPAAPHGVHPLHNRAAGEVAMRRWGALLNGNEFYLADHRIAGQPVLPAVAYLEMVCAALTAATDGARQVWFEDMLWLQPCIIGGGPLALDMELAQKSDGSADFEIYGTRADGSRVVYAQGRAGTEARTAAAPLDLVHLQSQAGTVYGAEQCYAAFATLGFRYGPGHRAIERLLVGSDNALALVRLPAALAPTLGQFGLHPSLADAALQATIGFALAAPHGASLSAALPFELERAEVLGPCSATMWAVVRRRGSEPESVFDIELCDEAGRVAVRWHGLATRNFDAEALVAATRQDERAVDDARSEALGRPRAEALALLGAQLRREAGQILGLEPAALDTPARPFQSILLAEFGMDSLSATKLRNNLRQRMGGDVRVQQIIAEPAGRLAELLYEQLLLRQVRSAPVVDEDTESFEF